jgi:hypothetical protein
LTGKLDRPAQRAGVRLAGGESIHVTVLIEVLG